jgi:hypothetical protein
MCRMPMGALRHPALPNINDNPTVGSCAAAAAQISHDAQGYRWIFCSN